MAVTVSCNGNIDDIFFHFSFSKTNTILHTQGIRPSAGRHNKVAEYSSSSDELGSSDEEESTR